MFDSLKRLTEGLGPLFAQLERRSQATSDLTAKVREGLNATVAAHVVSANFRGETLVVIADSAAWATHVRYVQQELLDHMNASGENRVTKLKVKIGRT